MLRILDTTAPSVIQQLHHLGSQIRIVKCMLSGNVDTWPGPLKCIRLGVPIIQV